MAVRETFETELSNLRSKMIDLSKMAESALQKSINALQQQDIDAALEVMDEDVFVDQLDEEINDLAILMIAKQQPVATDLRRIIVAIRISSDVERMADFAVNIAKSTIRIGKEPFIKPLEHIPQMAEITLEMLAVAIEAFDKEDTALARKLAEMDDRVDELYGQTIKELLSLAADTPEKIGQITQLAFIARYLERTGDHATNIGESILYLVKGKRYALNE